PSGKSSKIDGDVISNSEVDLPLPHRIAPHTEIESVIGKSKKQKNRIGIASGQVLFIQPTTTTSTTTTTPTTTTKVKPHLLRCVCFAVAKSPSYKLINMNSSSEKEEETEDVF
ncbi:hypothetical protein M5D96_011859, partial [Drosophila gunungcola]